MTPESPVWSSGSPPCTSPAAKASKDRVDGLLLNLSSLLLLQVCLHLIDGLLHLLEGVELHGQGQGHESCLQVSWRSSNPG